MSSDDIARLIYLGMLILVIGGYALIAQRENLGQSLRHAILWVLIFVGAIAGFGLWTDVSETVNPRVAFSEDGGTIEVPREPDGHFYLTLEIDGTPVLFVVDTGATGVALSMQDADAIGIDTGALHFDGRASTANGVVRTARVTLQNVYLGDHSEGSLRASVNEGATDVSLLGMSYLERFSSLEIRGSRMLLIR